MNDVQQIAYHLEHNVLRLVREAARYTRETPTLVSTTAMKVARDLEHAGREAQRLSIRMMDVARKQASEKVHDNGM